MSTHTICFHRGMCKVSVILAEKKNKPYLELCKVTSQKMCMYNFKVCQYCELAMNAELRKLKDTCNDSKTQNITH